MSDPDSSSDLDQSFKTCSESGTEEFEETPRLSDNAERRLYAAPAVQPGGANVQVSGNAVHISEQGATYNFYPRANVHFHTGASVTQQLEGSYPPKVSDMVQNMKRSKNAEYNMSQTTPREACTPGTRVAQLEMLDRWSKYGMALLYWLSGITGTGKTTLSVSFSETLNKERRLGASFFCSRSLEDCRDVKLIIPTVSHQLAMRYPVFERALAIVLARDPDVDNRSLDSQLQKLILDPWHSCSKILPKDSVVVLDALDECQSGHEEFLKAIFKHAENLPFKLLITSRPSFSILETMKTKDPKTLSTFNLYEVEKDLVEADIATYLNCCLSPRIDPEIIDELKDLSGSSFIFAATVTKLFTSGNVNAKERLERFKKSVAARQVALASLYELYYGVLCSALQGGGLFEEEVRQIKDVLFLIVCARDPLTIVALAGILDISLEELVRRLNSLHSVLFVPKDCTRPVVIFHASFVDFLLDRSQAREFFCDPALFHLQVTRFCLKVLTDQLPLERSLEDPIDPNPNSPALQYAAVNWTGHLALSDSSSRRTIFGTISEILAGHVLHWIELLGLLGQLSVVIQSLECLLSVVDKGADLGVVAYEYLCMVQHHYETIRDDSKMIYQLITFIPLDSPLHRLHSTLLSSFPKVLCGLPNDWLPLERVINIHSDIVRSIAISQDGSRMVSGSEDQTVQIWNIGRYTQECGLTGHTDQVSSVAITRDGSRVISGCNDQTIRIWDVTTKKELSKLKASGRVSAVAISSDDKYFASGDWSGQIQIWNAADGKLLRTLTGHTDMIRSLTFVPNT